MKWCQSLIQDFAPGEELMVEVEVASVPMGLGS